MPNWSGSQLWKGTDLDKALVGKPSFTPFTMDDPPGYENYASNIVNPPSQDNDAKYTWKEPQIRCPNCGSVINGLDAGNEKVPLGSPALTALGHKKPVFNQDPITPPMPSQTQALRLVYRVYPCGCQVSQEWAGAYTAEVLRRKAGQKPGPVVEMTASQREAEKKKLLAEIGELYDLKNKEALSTYDVFHFGVSQEIEAKLVAKIDRFMRLCPGEHNRLPKTKFSAATTAWAKKNNYALPPEQPNSLPTLNQIAAAIQSGKVSSAVAVAESVALTYYNPEAVKPLGTKQFMAEMMGEWEQPPYPDVLWDPNELAKMRKSAPSGELCAAYTALHSGCILLGWTTVKAVFHQLEKTPALDAEAFAVALAASQSIKAYAPSDVEQIWEVVKAIKKIHGNGSASSMVDPKKAGYTASTVPNPQQVAQQGGFNFQKAFLAAKSHHPNPNLGPTKPEPESKAKTAKMLHAFLDAYKQPLPPFNPPFVYGSPPSGAPVPPVTGQEAKALQPPTSPPLQLDSAAIQAAAHKIYNELVAHQSQGTPLSAEAEAFMKQFGQPKAVPPSTAKLLLRPTKETAVSQEELKKELGTRKRRKMARLKPRKNNQSGTD